jgi:hypothetical protein
MILFRSPALNLEVRPTVPVLQDLWSHSRSCIHRPPTTRPAFPLETNRYTRRKATVHTVDPVLPPNENDGCFTVELERPTRVAISRGKHRLDDDHEEDLLVFESCRRGYYSVRNSVDHKRIVCEQRKERDAPSPSRVNLVLISSSVKLQAAHKKTLT